MPFRTFNTWLFDRNKTSPIPPAKDGVDILKYNSPISHTFVMQMFMRNGYLNKYLDEYFNNIGLRYLTKEEFFYFIKKCVCDFRVKKSEIVYYKFRRQDKLYNILREKFPQFKNDDISLLAELIEKSEDRDVIYQTLGLDMPIKKKLKNSKKRPAKGKVSLKNFLAGNFSILKEVPLKKS
jgi:hypothetical protein